jgi:hypothetical protein
MLQLNLCLIFPEISLQAVYDGEYIPKPPRVQTIHKIVRGMGSGHSPVIAVGC